MQARLDAGEKPHFLPETRRVRESDWKVRLAAYFKSADIVISFSATGRRDCLDGRHECMYEHALAVIK